MGSNKEINNQIATKYKVNKRRKMETPFLCYEIIFHIFVWLPADVLYKKMRYICKQCYDIIKGTQFIKKQQLLCPQISAGLFFQCYTECNCYFVLLSSKHRWGAVSKLVTFPSHLVRDFMSISGKMSNYIVVDTYDGLMLIQNKTTKRLQVANPLTKQLLTLPPICDKYLYGEMRFALGHARSTMEHKVIFIHDDGIQLCGVITLGKDDPWRIIYLPDLYPGNFDLRFSGLHSVGSFVYLCDHSVLITFNLEYERFYVSHLPKIEAQYFGSCRYFLVKGGDTLSCLIGAVESSYWEVWVSPCKSVIHKWKKSHVIDFLPQKHKLRRMVKILFRNHCYYKFKPVAWINNGDVLVFRTSSEPDPFIAYNVQTGKFSQLRWHDNHPCKGFIKPFTPSLLSLNQEITCSRD